MKNLFFCGIRNFILSLFLFGMISCNHSIPEPIVPEVEIEEDTPIRQKDFIPVPSLWAGPSLSDKGFLIEVQPTAYGTRDRETTINSIEKYNLGESKSALPSIAAEEWGYSVLHLKTGQKDGAGRVITNTYLDNLANITTKKQALESIMEFVKKQYKVVDGKQWYSMNGHYCWHHFAGLYGADVIGSEIGENVHGYQLHIAMNRGAAKQYNTPWFIDFSSWHGPSILDYCKNKVWIDYSGPTHGHSINLVERSMLMSYMSGADAVVAEAGGLISFLDDVTSDGCYQLSPYGKVFQKLNAFSKKYDIGITYTPIAILLNKYHGMDRQPCNQKAFGKFQYTKGDMETFNLIETIWPKTFSVETNGNEVGAMVNSKYPDQIDFLLQDAPLKLLKTYKIIMLSGDIQLTDTQIENLKTYAKEGGIVLADNRNFEQFGFTGLSGSEVKEKILDKGKVVTYQFSSLTKILDNYFTTHLPIKVIGDVEYFINVANDAFIVTIINNDGVTKRYREEPIFDSSKCKDVKIIYSGKHRIDSIEELWDAHNLNVDGNEVSFRMLPGDCYVVRLSSK